MYISELLRRLCSGDPDFYSFVIQNKRKISWMWNHYTDWEVDPHSEELINGFTFKSLGYFIKHHKKLPESIDNLKAFVEENTQQIKFLNKNKNDIRLNLDNYKNWECDADIAKMETAVLFDAGYHAIRNAWHLKGLHDGIKTITGTVQHDDDWKIKSDESNAGVALAVQTLRERWLDDFKDELPKVEGMLDENTSAAKDVIKRLMPGQDSKRFATGYEHVDRHTTIGKNDCRFIGILGQAGDGKSTFLNNILYNMLLDGANILLISMESDPDKMFARFAYLHSNHPDYRGHKLPSWHDLRKGRWSEKDAELFERILNDIKDRKNLPGRLDVRQIFDWEDIKSYLSSNQKKNQYDILAIDYLANINLPAKIKAFEKERYIDSVVQDAQQLSIGFDNNKGLVVITPIAVNREASKAALKTDEDQRCSHYTINAIRQFTSFQYALDLCISVYSDDDMKANEEMEVGCVKHRDGRKFEYQNLKVQERTGSISEKTYSTPDREVTMDDVESMRDGIDDLWRM